MRRVARSTCWMPRPVVRWSIARARPSSSADEAFCMEAESFAACRANFCQGESSPELETIFQGRGVPFSPSHHATICVNSFRNEHCRRQRRGRAVDTGGSRSTIRRFGSYMLMSDTRRSQPQPRFVYLGCAAGFQETRDVRKRVLRRPHYWRLAVRVLR